MKLITKHGNWGEISRRVMNMGKQMERSMRDVIKPWERINFLIEKHKLLGEYINSMIEIAPENTLSNINPEWSQKIRRETCALIDMECKDCNEDCEEAGHEDISESTGNGEGN